MIDRQQGAAGRAFAVFTRGQPDVFDRLAGPREIAAEVLESAPADGAPARSGDTGGEKYDKLPPQSHIVEVDIRAVPGVMLKLPARRLSKFPAMPGMFSFLSRITGAKMEDILRNPALKAPLPGGEENEFSDFFPYALIYEPGDETLWIPDMAEFQKRCVAESNAIFKNSGGRRK